MRIQGRRGGARHEFYERAAMGKMIVEQLLLRDAYRDLQSRLRKSASDDTSQVGFSLFLAALRSRTLTPYVLHHDRKTSVPTEVWDHVASSLRSREELDLVFSVAVRLEELLGQLGSFQPGIPLGGTMFVDSEQFTRWLDKAISPSRKSISPDMKKAAADVLAQWMMDGTIRQGTSKANAKTKLEDEFGVRIPQRTLNVMWASAARAAKKPELRKPGRKRKQG